MGLTAFIPMLMDTGGNCGAQVSTLVIRGLALNQVQFRDFFKVLWKEFRVSLMAVSYTHLTWSPALVRSRRPI